MAKKDSLQNHVVASRRRRRSNPIAASATGLSHRPLAGAPRTWSPKGNDTAVPTGLPSDYKCDERILAPIPGTVTQVFVKAGDRVQPGDLLLVIEAMKMKNTLRAGHALHVTAVHVKAGETIKADKLLVEFGDEKYK